jgi:hypothetical protein
MRRGMPRLNARRALRVGTSADNPVAHLNAGDGEPETSAPSPELAPSRQHAKPGLGQPSKGWWTQASALASIHSVNTPPMFYRLGGTVLQLESELPELLRYFADHYGECAMLGLACEDPPSQHQVVRCSVLRCSLETLVSVVFDAPGGVDAFQFALALLKHPATAPRYIEQGHSDPDNGLEGWHLIVEAATGIPVIAARSSQALIDCSRLSLRELCQLIINPVFAVQREVLFVHAASIGIGGAGVILIGPSHSGKTTTALTLASRGHTYLGDDVAVIHNATAELMPFWRTAHIRPGPHARALASHLETGQWDPPYRDGLRRMRLRVAEVFPQPAVAYTPLRLALFLCGFAGTPRLRYFQPSFEELGRSSRFALNNTLWVGWGTTPQRRLMQFMLFTRLLSRIRCARLDVGEPEATADLIENTLEE